MEPNVPFIGEETKAKRNLFIVTQTVNSKSTFSEWNPILGGSYVLKWAHEAKSH